MKIVLILILYAVMVGTLNLGGVVWNSLRATHADKATPPIRMQAQKNATLAHDFPRWNDSAAEPTPIKP